MQVVFKLEKAAKSTGGDKYSAGGFNKPFVVYFPQEVSRVQGVVRSEITITIDPTQ